MDASKIQDEEKGVKKFLSRKTSERKWPNSIKIVNAIFPSNVGNIRSIYRKDAGSSLLWHLTLTTGTQLHQFDN